MIIIDNNTYIYLLICFLVWVLNYRRLVSGKTLNSPIKHKAQTNPGNLTGTNTESWKGFRVDPGKVPGNMQHGTYSDY